MTDDLRAILSRYPAALQPTSAPEPLGNAGGASGARLWRFETGRGRKVLRAWPTDGPGLVAVRWIHRCLVAAGGLGFVPVPERDRRGETVQEHAGRLWEVAPWMPGIADVARPPASARLRAGFAGLGAFHQAMAAGPGSGPSPGLAARLAEIEDLRRGGFEELRDAVDRAPADPRRDLARRWLELASRLAPRVAEAVRPLRDRRARLQPCLRDARAEHLLFEGDRLTGLVDFGAMGIEAVSADLARLLAEWVGPDRRARAEALGTYAAVRPLDADETALIEAFERTGALLGGGRWVRWHFVEGRRFDDASAVLTGLGRGLERLTSLVAEAGLVRG
jgi:Ser/Thr protein kinase RdoA (MazF antagonist)